MISSYPRDMIGYGAEPPHAQWPDEARIALQFVINYEEGAENAILHGDPSAEAFLSESIGAQPTLGMRNMNIESLYEYGSRDMSTAAAPVSGDFTAPSPSATFR